MATEEVKITRKTKGDTWYLAFTGSDGEIRAATKRPGFSTTVKIIAFLMVIASGALVGIVSKSSPLLNTSIGVACMGAAVGVLQRVFAPKHSIELRTADGFICTARLVAHPWASTYKGEVPNSAMRIEILFFRKGRFEAQVEGDTAVTAHLRKVRWLEVPRPLLHVDFEDRAGRTATLDRAALDPKWLLSGKGVEPRAYKLAYDAEFDPQWLLFLVAAVFLQRKGWG
jgi:hypothetical protein